MNIERYAGFNNFFHSHELSVSENGFAIVGSDWKQAELHSPWSRLYYVIDGDGCFVCQNEEIPITRNRVYLAPCGIPYGFYTKGLITKLYFHVNIIKPDGYDLFSSPDMRITSIPYEREKSEHLLELYRADDPIKQLQLKAEIYRTVAEFASIMLKRESARAARSQRTEAAIAFIRGNLSASLSVGEVAGAVFCSAGHLTECFKREMGISVAKYIDDLLMFEARKLLADDKTAVGDVSAALGFCDQFYFSRLFTKRFSITPREYKKIKK